MNTHFFSFGLVTPASKQSNRSALRSCYSRITLTLLFLLSIGVGNMWAADKTITLDISTFGSPTSYSKKTATVSGVGFTIDQVLKATGTNAGAMQMNSTKGSGTLYNTTAITGLKSIDVTIKSGNKQYTVTTGTSQNPTGNSKTGTTGGTYNASSGDTYFQFKVSGATYITSIVITYDDSGGSSDPSITSATSILSFSAASGSSDNKSFTFSATNLTADVTLALSGANSGLFSLSETSVSKGSGTITDKSITVTYSPTAAGSHTAKLTLSSGTATKEITLSGEATAPAAKYTVSFNVGGSTGSQADITEASAGAGITLPAGPTPTCSSDDWTFAGWAEAPVTSSTTTAPTLLSAGANYKPAADCTLYAVYSKTETSGDGGTSWTRVTSIATLTGGGTFIMGYESTAKSGEIVPLRSKDSNATTSANGYFNTGTTDGSSTDGMLDMTGTITNSGDYEVYISSPASGVINIQQATSSGNYYGATSGGSTSNKARLYTSGNSNETNLTPEWASESNNQFKLTAAVSGQYKYLKYNTGSPRFAYYNSAGDKIVFYKKGSGGSSTTYYWSSPTCEACTKQVTITKGTPSNGSFDIDKTGAQDNCTTGGLVVHISNISPVSGYQFKEITQSGIVSGVTIDQDAKTVTYAKDVDGASTINVVFEEIQTYNAKFYNLGSQYGSTQIVAQGGNITKPANPEACDGYAFYGWASSPVATTTTAPTIISSWPQTMGSADVNYYAVYRWVELGGGGTADASHDWDMEYAVTGWDGTMVEYFVYQYGFKAANQYTMNENISDFVSYASTASSIQIRVSSFQNGSTGSVLTVSLVNSSGTELTSQTITPVNGSGVSSATEKSVTFTSNLAYATGYKIELTTKDKNVLVTETGYTITYETGTAYYSTSASCSGHTITVADVEHGFGASDKNRCDEGGTVTITLTADAGYDCGSITTSPVVSVTKVSDCTFTFPMPDADITVTPSFTPKAPRTYTFVAGTGNCDSPSLTESAWNAGVTLPTATANSGCEPEYTFAGWATASVSETETRPTLYLAGDTYKGETTKLYAVYTQTSSGSGTGFTLSYTYNDITYYATARPGSNSYMGASTDEANAARFSIITSGGKKYLCWHGENDTYVHNSNNTTSLSFTTDLANASDWTVTEDGASSITLTASSGRYFTLNTSTKDRFSTYGSPSDALTKGDAGTTLYNTNPSCICYSVDITYDANGGTLAAGCSNVTGGDCERDWLLCDAPTREGFLFTKWKDQNGKLYDAGESITNLKTSLELTAQWIEAPYTVLFDAGSGTSVSSLTEPSRGDGIILPKADPSAACSEDWTFVGWSATKLEGETNTSASIVGTTGIPYTPTSNNTTLYAVYSSLDEGGASTDYTRVTATTPEEGDYVVVLAKNNESFGLLTYGTTSSGRLTYSEAYTALPAIISSPATTQIWHLSYDGSGYAYLFNTEAGAYLSLAGTYNMTFNGLSGSAFVFTRDAGIYGDYRCLNNTASSSSSSNYYLGVNKDYDYVRYYVTSTLVSTDVVTLYKGSTGTRYYATEPYCTPCTDPEWSFELGTSVEKAKGSEPFTNTVIKKHESSGTVSYFSTDESVATIDATGEVTLVGTGSTTITLRLTKAMPYCATVMQYELIVKEPSIEIVGVTADGEIIMEHDLEGDITLDLSEGENISTGTAANDLFFSKYFEAASHMKLFAIFNGTGHEVDLTHIRVRSNCTTAGTGKWSSKTGDLGYVELRTVSKLREQYPKLKIPSGTELIFWSNNKGGETNTSLRECIEFNIGDETYHYSDMEAMEIPNWFCLGSYTTYNVKDDDGNNQFVFNGDDSMILERYNPVTDQWEAIDVFGAGTSEDPANTDGLVENIQDKYTIDGVEQALNDGVGFHAECAGNPIPLSTNRYMLVRKSSVLDGLNAVESNKTSFATLCEEWDGTPVGGSTSAFCYSGEIFSKIAEYDYAENYIEWHKITTDLYEKHELPDGTIAVEFTGLLDLDDRACTLLKIEVRDKEDATKLLASTEYKIPIVVKAGEHSTTDALFRNQGDKCATCDVAILGSAVLTKAEDGTTNDMPEVRDIYVYGGGQLIIPENANYKAHDLVMRMQMADDNLNMNVPNIKVVGSLTNQYGGTIRQQVRIGTSRFYQFAVPYVVRLEDVTFSDGTPAIYGEDFMIRYYDGEQRAQNLGKASNWRNYEGTELYPGVGYTLAVAKKPGHAQRELIFPMSGATLEGGEPLTKETTIHAWGDNTIRANHRGWNFLSNPYLTTYAKDNLDGDAGNMLTTGKLVDDPEHPGWWINNGGVVPYVTLINSARTDYDQGRVEDTPLLPFTTFFIQAGDDTHADGAEFSLTFDRDHRASAPAYYRKQNKVSIARFGVMLSGNSAKDKCGVVVGDTYTAAYDMQADLGKEFGSAYSLKLYTLQEDNMQMAFLATHPDSLNKPIPVGVRLPASAEYTFEIDKRYNLGAFKHIYLTDNVTGQHVDLMEETYTFTGARQQNDTRFSLFVEMEKGTTTSVDNFLNGIYVVGRTGSLMLTGLPQEADIYIYDMSGRIVMTQHTSGQTSVVCPVSGGVYQIRVMSDGAKALLKTIVY